MNNLDFSYNWNNKLDCQAFTTLRLTDKYNINDTLKVMLRKEFRGFVMVVDKRRFTLNKINDFIAYIDTGYNQQECVNILTKMYKNKNIDWEKQEIYFYLLKKIKEKKNE